MKHLYTFLFLALLFPFLLPSQTLNWAHSAGGDLQDYTNSVQYSANGNVIVTGQFIDSVDFDPGAGTAWLVSATTAAAYIACYDPAGAYLWAVSLNGGFSRGIGLVTDIDNNIYVAGEFSGTVDFDPGAGSFLQSSTAGSLDGFVMKLSGGGNLVWAGMIGGNQSDLLNAVAWDSSNGLAAIGNVGDDADLDPTASVSTFVNIGTSDHVVVRMDTAGAFIWGSLAGGPLSDTKSSDIVFDADGNLWSCGSYWNDIDADPSAGSATLTSTGLDDIFIQKLDGLTGAYLWSGTIGGVGNDRANGIARDAAGNILTGGVFQSTADLDPNITTDPHTSAGNNDIFIIKLTSAGSLIWSAATGGVSSDWLADITCDPVGSVYSSGQFLGTADFSPGAPVVNKSSAGINDYFVLKLSSSGGFEWVGTGGGTGGDRSSCLSVNAAGNIVVGGWYNGTTDLDPDTSTVSFTAEGTEDSFVLELEQDSCASLTLAATAVDDVSCASGTGLISTSGSGGTLPYSWSWSTGATTPDIMPTTAGIYSTTLTDATGCTSEATFLLGAPSYVTGYDLEVNTAVSPLRPGMNGYIFVDAYNTGCTPISGEVQVILDPGVVYVSAIPTPASISGDTLRWNFTALSFDTPHFTALIVINVPVTTAIGDTLCFDFEVSPLAGDEDPFDNIHLNECHTVIGSYDPNDKQVYPRGECAEHYVPKNDPLTYTIQFQNTGTADAIDVYILDTLDTDLDLASVHIKAHSHPMWTEVLPGNVLKFVYNGINLPDSTSDEPGSHGYVMYQVHPMSGLPDGTMIHNGSAIYFDYNDPVITNTTHSTLMDILPPCTPTYGGQAPVSQVAYSIYPNPADDIITLTGSDLSGEVLVTNVWGQVVLNCQAGPHAQTILRVSHLPSGVYFLHLTQGDQRTTKRFQVMH